MIHFAPAVEDDTLSTIWFRRPTWGIKNIPLVPEVLKCDPRQSLKSEWAPGVGKLRMDWRTE